LLNYATFSRRVRLLRFASWIEGGSGGDRGDQYCRGEDGKALQLRDKADREMRKYISEHRLEAFHRTIVAPDFRNTSGCRSLL
jgi:hypothetical protein